MTQTDNDWMVEFRRLTPLLGHRNWIIIVDKAFPLQSAAGMNYFNTDMELLDVLAHVLDKVSRSTHIKPIIYNDMELSYISEDMAEGCNEFRQNMADVLEGYEVNTLLHEDVFSKLDEASKLFNVMVLKTDTTIPYTSVFIELDCGYWSNEKEAQMRKNMKQILG